jgi:hypothetical protein
LTDELPYKLAPLTPPSRKTIPKSADFEMARAAAVVIEPVSTDIILNRKNALFAGSDGGAERCAVIASVIETCKLTTSIRSPKRLR